MLVGNQKITPNSWFDDQAEAAARYYVSVFAMTTMLQMTKLDIAALKRAHDGPDAASTAAAGPVAGG